jgi:hypothetical protein
MRGVTRCLKSHNSISWLSHKYTDSERPLDNQCRLQCTSSLWSRLCPRISYLWNQISCVTWCCWTLSLCGHLPHCQDSKEGWGILQHKGMKDALYLFHHEWNDPPYLLSVVQMVSPHLLPVQPNPLRADGAAGYFLRVVASLTANASCWGNPSLGREKVWARASIRQRCHCIRLN